MPAGRQHGHGRARPPGGRKRACATSDLPARERQEPVRRRRVRVCGLLGIIDSGPPVVVLDQLVSDVERDGEDLLVVDVLAGRLGDVRRTSKPCPNRFQEELAGAVGCGLPDLWAGLLEW